MSISNIETGKSPFPLRRVEEYAHALSVEVEKLNRLLLTEKLGEYSEILQVSTTGRFEIDDNTIVVARSRITHRRKIPVLGLVEGGPNGEWDDEGYPVGEGRYKLPCPEDVEDDNAFGLEIIGESMSPRFEPGDVVIVSPVTEVINGDYAVCRLENGDSMAKKVKFKGDEVILESVNPSYPPMIMPKSNLLFCYKIVWIKPKH